MLEARFLGNFEILIDGVSIDLPARKAQALLAFLVMNRSGQHRREKLAGMLWPDSDESSARSKLRYALWQLRNSVGDNYFSADKITISLDPDVDIWLDCDNFQNRLAGSQTTENLEEIAALYLGDFLPGFYEDWILLERDRLRASFDLIIVQLIERLYGEGLWREVIEWSEKWISFGQAPEKAYQAIMAAQSRSGDKTSALNTYLRLEQVLDEELGVDPSKTTRQMYEAILHDEQPVFQSSIRSEQVIDSAPMPRAVSSSVTYEEDASPETFVAREKETDWLISKLHTSLEGEGQLAFVLGDAGQGKTALLKHFARVAQDSHEELVITYATCEAFSGIGDPYLPLRNILGLLCGDVAAKQTPGVINQENAQRLWDMIPLTAQVLLREGQGLLDAFINSDALLRRAHSYTLEQPTWLSELENEIQIRKNRPLPMNVDHGDSRKDLNEQYVRVMQKISQSHPLILILDDMQWADPGSLSLLFHLARRIKRFPILIIGSYRPADIAHEDHLHPLAELLPEFARIFGELEINLNQSNLESGRKFVDEYLDSEPNTFDDDFRQSLHLQTSGQPLFTIELLRQMQEENSIVKDQQGRWESSGELSWEAMPAKVEAVIENRINRLSPDLRKILNVASIEGEEFTGELIAAVTGEPEAKIINHLSRELTRQHRLVQVSEVKRIGHQRLSIYRFQHNLFQKFIYDNLDQAEKSYLHEQIGNALEQIYGAHNGLIASQLALHFEYSGLINRAIDYLLQAGKNAKRVSAYAEAVSLLEHGLELMQNLPESERQPERELAFQISLGPVQVAVLGYGAEEVEDTYERARDLCEQTGDVDLLAPALWGLCAFYQVKGRHRTALQMAEQIESVADKNDDPDLRFLSHWMLGFTHTHLGDFTAAKEHFENALSSYDSSRDELLTYLYGQNPRVTCLTYLALTLWISGYLDEADEKCKQAISYAEKICHPYTLTFAHGTAALFHVVRRDPKSALLHSEKAYRLAKQSGFPFFLALGMLIRGWSRYLSGKKGMSKRLVKNGIEAMEIIGTELGKPFFLSLLAETMGLEEDESSVIIKDALQGAEENQELWFNAAIYWQWGKAGESRNAPADQVLDKYMQAAKIASEQKARSFIVRATMASLKFDDQGEHAQAAREMLANTYQWFDPELDDELLIGVVEALNSAN